MLTNRFFGLWNEAEGGGSGAGSPAATPPAGAPDPGAAGGGSLLAPTPSAGGTPPAAPAADWKASMPPQFFADPSMSSFSGFESQAEMLEALGKSYVETKRMVGAKAPVRPPTDAPPEAQAAWRKLVGAPDDPKGYGETLRPEGFDESLWSKETESKFRDIAFRHNLTPEAAKELAGMHAELVNQGLDLSAADEATAYTKEVTALRTEWGKDFEQNAHQASSFAQMLGLTPDDPIFKEGKYAKAMFAGAKLVGEKTLPGGKFQSATAGGESWARGVMDAKSSSDDARAYRGEFGQDRQIEAQTRLSSVLQALEKAGTPYRP